MAEEDKDFTVDAHKKFAIEFFNHAWGASRQKGSNEGRGR